MGVSDCDLEIVSWFLFLFTIPKAAELYFFIMRNQRLSVCLSICLYKTNRFSTF